MRKYAKDMPDHLKGSSGKEPAALANFNNQMAKLDGDKTRILIRLLKILNSPPSYWLDNSGATDTKIAEMLNEIVTMIIVEKQSK